MAAFYIFKPIIADKGKIILTDEGVELFDKGFYKWIDVESYAFVERMGSESPANFLIVILKNGHRFKFGLDTLRQNALEIKSLFESFHP